MKDIQATMRRLDEEITGHNQQIARHRVEIARLQETRLVLMGIAESDIAAAEHAVLERQGIIAGEHAKPVLIVRKAGTIDALSQEHRAAGETLNIRENEATAIIHEARSRAGPPKHPGGKPRDYAHEREMARARQRRQMPLNGSSQLRGPNMVGASAKFRERILQTLEGDAEGMTRKQLGDYFGLPIGEKARKNFSNGLYRLEQTGRVVRDEQNRYRLK